MLAQNGNEHARTFKFFRWGILGFFVLVGAAIVVSILLRALTSGPYYPGFFFFPFGFLLLFLFFFGFRWFFRPWGWGYYRGDWGQRYDAVEILRQRYARGEITKDQFDQMLRDLQQPR